MTMTDQKEYELLIKNHIGMIRKISRSYSNNQFDYEDNVQEVCLQIWRSFGKFRGEAKQNTWLYRIAINTCINQLKKRSNQKINEAEEQFIAESQDLLDPKNEQLKQIYDAIKELNPTDRAIILLYLDKNSLQEISDVMGISTTNVGVKIGRIKNKLKKLIDHGT